MALPLHDLLHYAARDLSDDVGGAGSNMPAPRDRTEPSGESTLVARLREGDLAAFDEIVLAYDRPLRDFARRMLHRTDVADDMVQDIFMWLWERRHTVQLPGTLRAYLYGAVRHRVLHYLRRERLEERCAVEIDPNAGVPGMGTAASNTAAAAERAELAVALTNALSALPPRVRQTAMLRWRDQLSRAEIAAVMGVAIPTVNNQLTRAAQIVRVLLGPHAPSGSPAPETPE